MFEPLKSMRHGEVPDENHNNPKLIPVDRLFMNDLTLLKEIPKEKEIVTVCAHGHRSMIAAKCITLIRV